MAPRSSYHVPGNQRGKFINQKPDGSIVISAPAGYNFVLSGANIGSTGMGRLLAVGLRRNESIYWTTRGVFEGARIDQIYCDRIDNPSRSVVPSTPSHQANHGDNNGCRLSPYDEPHPFSLHRSGDVDSTRRQSLGNHVDYNSHQERARRGSVTYEQPPLYDNLGPLQATQSSYDSLPPPYSSGESPPPYTSISRSQDDMDVVVPTRPRSIDDDQHRMEQRLSWSRRIRNFAEFIWLSGPENFYPAMRPA